MQHTVPIDVRVCPASVIQLRSRDLVLVVLVEQLASCKTWYIRSGFNMCMLVSARVEQAGVSTHTTTHKNAHGDSLHRLQGSKKGNAGSKK